MSKVRILFHSSNPTFEQTLRRFAKGLDRYVVRFPPSSNSMIDDFSVNFVFGSIIGNNDEIRRGVELLKFAQDNLRVFNRRVPMGIAVDLEGLGALKTAGIEPSSVRLIVLVGEPSTFPNVSPLACPRAKRVDVLSINWSEDDLDRVRAGLVGATSPFSYGGM